MSQSPLGRPPIAQIILDSLDELDRATTKFPGWPSDPLHAVGVVNEEVGELNRAILQAVYELDKYPDANAEVREEAIQPIAMLVRFVLSLDAAQYNWNPSDQIVQSSKNRGSRTGYDSSNLLGSKAGDYTQ
jgi:hypothetical protein